MRRSGKGGSNTEGRAVACTITVGVLSLDNAQEVANSSRSKFTFKCDANVPYGGGGHHAVLVIFFVRGRFPVFL